MILFIKKFLANVFLRVAIKFHESSLSSNFSSIYLENFVNFFRGVKSKFYFDRKSNNFYIIENNKKINFNNKLRGIKLYRDGISKRAKSIFLSYCLDKITFSKNDIVIDCGANYGDLYLKLSNFIEPKNYIGIEPSPVDFETLKLNTNDKCTIINKGLSNINGELPFYVSLSGADSSFIEPNYFQEIIKIPVIRLDKLIEELNLHKIKLLKIDAEGYEPEVLEGLGLADKTEICEYIAIDGGYERGVKNEQTLTIVNNYLLDNNFKMIDINLRMHRALFVNRKKVL